MKTIEVHVSEMIAERIEAAAVSRGITTVEFIRQSIEEKLERDAAFEVATKYVLSKNAGLYERLS